MPSPPQKIHFIAVGGAVMHNLALALHQQGADVTGSDDEIRDPSRTRLAAAGLLPDAEGWFPARVTADLDAVIVGMHARPDNPELERARVLGLPIYSFPEYVYHRCRNKQRVVIAGSHGKTTITSAIMHVLRYFGHKFDYLVGAQLDGFDLMVQLTDDAPVVIIEGDEYPASPDDLRPKFLHYHHHIGLISGIAWDHVNVYPDFDAYVRPFEQFADATPKSGTLLYCEEDDLAAVICRKERDDVTALPYEALPAEVADGTTYLLHDGRRTPLQVFGRHNLLNLGGAKGVCQRLGVTEAMFWEAIA
ncbi:MAG: Mur ligase domain-containing protein, partial [Catalinimonas sp.]